MFVLFTKISTFHIKTNKKFVIEKSKIDNNYLQTGCEVNLKKMCVHRLN